MPRRSSTALAFAPNTGPRIHPPADLTGDARRVFIDLVVAARPDFFEDSDGPLLAVYSKAIILERAASAGLAADGYVTADGKVSPWASILKDAQRTMSTYSRMLRLNPSARPAAPSSSEPDAPVSYYERQRLLEGRRDEPNGH